MANRTRVVVFMAAALLASGCSSGDGGVSSGCRSSAPSANGPGDVSNHFPLSVGSRWYYEMTETVPGSTARSRWSLEVTGTRAAGGTTASVFRFTRLDGLVPPEELLLAKGPSGVYELADGSLEPPLDQVMPSHLLTFPLTAGSSFEQFSCTGLDYGSDLDGDGKNEQIDMRSTVTVVGEEGLTLPAGSFVAMKVDTLVTMTLRAATGQSVTATGVESAWYAPGVGRVKSTSTMTIEGFTESSEEVLLGYDVEGRRGGLTRLATLATNVAFAISDTETPGRPALAFDGAGHLLVWKTDPDISSANESLRAHVLAPDGSTVRQLAPADRQGSGFRPAAAFNGTSHLVVSNVCATTTDCSTMFAQRVTPAGDLLDGPAGFDITTGGQTVYAPAVASDGAGWLVGWARYLGGLELARVPAEGAPLPPFAIPGATPSDRVAIAFGGGVYLVVWVQAGDVVAVRVQPDGTVLDLPFAISTAPGDKSLGGVAFDGTRFLVVWGDPRRGETWMNVPVHDLYAARVAADGTLLDGPPDTGGIAVNAFPGVTKADPVVAFDGSHFVITWWIDGFYGDVGVFAARIGGDGSLLDGPVSGPGLRIASPTAGGSRLVHPVVVPAAGAQALLAWVDNTEVYGATKKIEGAWYAW